MHKEHFSENQLRAAGSAVSNAIRLKDYARELGKLISETLEKEHPREHWGSTYSFSETTLEGELTTPFGNGRTRFESKIGVNGAVSARFIVEKDNGEVRGQTDWQPVWSIPFNFNGMAKLGEDGPDFVDLSHTSDVGVEPRREVCLSLIASIAVDHSNP